jgi:hypothetical protein
VHVQAGVLILAIGIAVSFSTAEAQRYSTTGTVNGADGGSLSECMAAPGGQYIMEVAPGSLTFYTKDAAHTLSGTLQVNTLFGVLGSFDAVGYYDAVRGRFLVAALEATSGTRTMLAISKAGQSLPTSPSQWWTYYVSNPSPPDYPSLGLSDAMIVLRANIGSTGIVDNRFSLIDRAKAYDNTFAGGEQIAFPLSLSILDFDYGFEYRAVRSISVGNTVHLVGIGTDRRVSYRSLGGTPQSPTLSAPTLVLSAADVSGFAARQPDDAAGLCGQRDLEVNSRLPDIYARNGWVTLPIQVQRDYGDGTPPSGAIRIVRFNSSSPFTVSDNFYVGQSGIDYTHGSVYEDSHGTLMIGYDRSSVVEAASCYMTARRGAQQAPEYLVRSGTASYQQCRGGGTACAQAIWGDYTGMAVDETASNATTTKAYYFGEWARTAAQPAATALGSITATYGDANISGTVLSDASGVRTARANVPVELKFSGQVVAKAITDAAGAFAFGLLPTGKPAATYVIRMAWPAAVALQATAGSGAFDQSVIDAADIQVIVQQGETSSGNQFVVAQQPLPSISSLSPSMIHTNDPDFSLVVTGTSFRAHSVVQLNGRDLATTFNPGNGTLTATVTHLDISRYPGENGTGIIPNQVAVFTAAAPGAGRSANAPLTALHEYLVSATFPTRVIGCPKGDAGHFVATLVVRSSPSCGIDAATTTASILGGAIGFKIWDAQTPFPEFPVFSIPGTKAFNAGVATFTFDVGKISGCATMAVSTQILKTDGTIASGGTYPVEFRSADGDGSVFGTVDKYDTSWLASLLGTNTPCGDLNNSGGSVDAGDLSFFSSHMGHFAQTRQVISPNGSEVYTRTATSVPTIPIRWATSAPLAGPQAKVTLNLISGTTSTPIATNLVDNGAFDWTDYCNVVSGTTYRVEVLHHAGILQPGDAILGSDRSDAEFSILGACGSGFAAGGAIDEGLPASRIPKSRELAPPRPNPTTGSVSITFGLPAKERVRLEVFDAEGRLVRTLADDVREAGYHEIQWSLTDTDGRRVRLGIYFFRLKIGSWQQRRKLAVVNE